MPRINGTGPLGYGPGTGWGMGPCGLGTRWGSGRGYGFGARRFISPENELAALEDEERMLKNELAAIEEEKKAIKSQPK